MTAGQKVYQRVVAEVCEHRLLRAGEKIVVAADRSIGAQAAMAFCASVAKELKLAEVRVIVRCGEDEDSAEDAADVARFARGLLLPVQVLDDREPIAASGEIVVTGETIELAAARVLRELLTEGSAIRGLVRRRRDGRVRPLLSCTVFEAEQMVRWLSLTPMVELPQTDAKPKSTLAESALRLQRVLHVLRSYEGDVDRVISQVPKRIRANHRKKC